ncbi:MAG: Coq4 family protein [Polyangiales bacterium]
MLSSNHPLYLPEQPSYLRRALVALRAFGVLSKDQAHGIAAPMLSLSMDAEIFRKLVATYAANEEGRTLLRERPDLQAGTIDLVGLRTLPEGTLGKLLAHYYEENGIAPFASPYPARNDVEYLAKRYRELHDMVHIVTGYGTDPISELELQAFVYGNLGLRHPVLILTLTGIFMPMQLPPIWTYFPKLRAAYRHGKASADVALRPRYERYWSTPIEDVRRAVGLASRG